jgi:hypothetical protein
MIMKINKVILLITAVVFIVVFVIFSMILRNTIYIRRSLAEKETAYRTIPSGDFNRLVLSDHVNVRIRQGKVCLVEYAASADSVKTFVRNLNGTLHIQSDSTFHAANTDLPVVKITMPLLLEITADQNAAIQLDSFQSDSIYVSLGPGCIFTGSNNTTKQLTFKTSGDALINITDKYSTP